MPTRKMSYCGGAYKDVGQQDRGCGGGVLSAFGRFNQWGGGGGGGEGGGEGGWPWPPLPPPPWGRP